MIFFGIEQQRVLVHTRMGGFFQGIGNPVNSLAIVRSFDSLQIFSSNKK